MNMPRQGVLLVVSGPSGVGKGTLIRQLLRHHPQVQVSVSCTTRPARPGEADGREYYFLSREEFDRRRAAGQLLEWAEVYPDVFYGTPREAVEQALARGQDLILEIDDQGARSVREALGNRAVLVCVAPPHFAALRDRLSGRKTETDDSLRERLSTARDEIANMGRYDYVVVNDEVAPAVAALEDILLAETHSLGVAGWRDLQAQLLAEAEAEEANSHG